MRSTAAGVLLRIIAVAAIYVLLAHAGFRFAYMVKQVSPVWPPSGFALAALLLWGVRLWPGIALGALIANYTSGTPLWVAAMIAVGNTLEGVAGAVVLQRFAKFRTSMDRVRDVGALVSGPVLLSTMIAATIGSVALCLGKLAAWHQFQWVWLTWWAGDGVGILVVAPAILVWLQPMSVLSHRRKWEAIGLAAVLLCITLLTLRLNPSHQSTLLHYFEFPVLIWAALRFRQRGATLALLVIAAASAWLTIRGSGPFAQFSQSINLRLLQAFVVALALTGLMLGAIAAERGRLHEELVAARDSALEASRAKSTFLANMSHELRTPLTAVIGYAEMLEEDADKAGPDRIAADLGSIRSAAMHLLSMINDILDLSKIEAGKLQILQEEVELQPLLDEVVATVRPLAAKNNNNVELQSSVDPAARFSTDPVRTRQILFNLLSNAAKFTHDGAVRLRVTPLEGPQSGWIEFSVEDNGIGMSADQVARLFQKFQQLDPGFTRRYGGTGLGLVISRYLAGKLGGTLTVESELAKGSTFTLRLPPLPPRAKKPVVGTEQVPATV